MRYGRLSREDRIAANVSPSLSRQQELPPHPQAQQNKLLTDRENENARYGKQCERSLAFVWPNDSALLACPHGQLVLLAPFACTNLRWGIGVLPQQTGVYIPRCLNQVNESMTGTLSHWIKTRDRRRRRRPRGLGPKQEGWSVAWPACCRSPRRTACRYPVLRPCITDANPGNLI